LLLAEENRDNLSLEELEKMESEELLTYIEDVETEKQRALAGLEALDAQEESYQKQLDSQQAELGTIQSNLDRYKESNLATEIEKTEKTVDAQREQLETLLSFSKNLKAQVAHLKERQEPLRTLVERLNLQEKALIRYIRINHDRGFMPSQAYEKPQDET
jgi:chromosome segregation ATPase